MHGTGSPRRQPWWAGGSVWSGGCAGPQWPHQLGGGRWVHRVGLRCPDLCFQQEVTGDYRGCSCLVSWRYCMTLTRVTRCSAHRLPTGGRGSAVCSPVTQLLRSPLNPKGWTGPGHSLPPSLSHVVGRRRPRLAGLPAVPHEGAEGTGCHHARLGTRGC